MRAAHLALPVMAMALTGCRPAAEIQAPPRWAVVERGDRRLDCYRIMSVRFHDGYQAGSFRARLDGEDITSWFTPPHNPGGLSHAVMSGPFTGGENPSDSSYNHHTLEFRSPGCQIGMLGGYVNS